MKKSKIAIATVVALGAIWTGSAWFTGKKIESQSKDFISNLNATIKAQYPDQDVVTTLKSYQRGIFTSKASLEIKINSNDKLTLLFDQNIDHGPFPLELIKQGNIAPAMAFMRAELKQTPPVNKLFAQKSDISPIQITSGIGYRGGLDSTIDIAPNSVMIDDDKQIIFSTEGARLNIKNDNRLDAINLSLYIKKIEAKKGSVDGSSLFTLSDLNYSSDSRLNEQQLRFGNVHISIGDMAFENKLSMAGVNIESNSESKNNSAFVKLNHSIEQIKLGNRPFGKLALATRLYNIDTPSLKALNNSLESVSRPDLQIFSLLNVFEKNAHNLLKREPGYDLTPLTLENEKGKSQLNFSFQLQDSSLEKKRDPASIVRDFVKKLDFNFDVSNEMLKESILRITALDKLNDKEAEAEAQKKFEEISTFLKAFELVKEENGHLVSNLSYAGDKVTFNGKVMSPEEFIKWFSTTSRNINEYRAYQDDENESGTLPANSQNESQQDLNMQGNEPAQTHAE